MEPIVNGLRDILQYVIGLAGLVAVGFILYGGFKYMSSRDDPRAVAGARTTLINATIGLILAVMAFPLTNWVIDRVAPGAGQVDPTVLENVVVEGVEFGLGGERDASAATAIATRTVQVKFSAPVCVEGQGSNLKLRTNRGNMNLVTAAATPDCETAIASQQPEIVFQIVNPGGAAKEWLAALTVSAIQKSGSVAIVSPSGAPVIDTLPTTYTCNWAVAQAPAKGSPCS